MKKQTLILLLLALCFGEVGAQQIWQFYPQLGEPSFQSERLSKDAYPLLVSPSDNWLVPGRNKLEIRPYNDPGTALPPMNWDCDPGILLIPQNLNCDPGIVLNPEKWQTQSRIQTFMIYSPPVLETNPFVTPFLLPGANFLLKEKELLDGGKLRVRDN